MLESIIHKTKMKLHGKCYGNPDLDFMPLLNESVPPLVSFLGTKKFLTGDSVTWIDFMFYEFCLLALFLNKNFFETYPSLEAYCKKVANLPGLKEYLEDPHHREATYAFNNKHAKIN